MWQNFDIDKNICSVQVEESSTYGLLYVYILVFDERGHFLIKYKIELDMIFTNNTIINMILLHIYMTIIP